MLRFASQQVKEQITQGDSLITIKDSNKRRLQESLAFMKEWSHDLLERENQMHVRIKEANQAFASAGAVQSERQREKLDIEGLITSKFLKRVESLFMKQLMVDHLHRQANQDSLDGESLNMSDNTFKSSSLNDNSLKDSHRKGDANFVIEF